MASRVVWSVIGTAAVMLVVLAARPGDAAVLCHTGPTSGTPGMATASASAKLLEATSEAMLAYRAVGEPAATEHRRRAGELLDAATAEYRRAQAMSEELAAVDRFLKARPFEQLRASFGIAPGTLNALRWDAITATARRSPAPASELIGVCVAGAQSLKLALTAASPGTSPAQVRRALSTWSLVLTHGGLVSDAFDPSVRVSAEEGR